MLWKHDLKTDAIQFDEVNIWQHSHFVCARPRRVNVGTLALLNVLVVRLNQEDYCTG